jgi:hypothetical protein
MVRKNTTKRKPQRPKQKIVYRTKYVERESNNPLSEVTPMVKSGAGAMITLGFTGAMLNAFRSM